MKLNTKLAPVFDIIITTLPPYRIILQLWSNKNTRDLFKKKEKTTNKLFNVNLHLIGITLAVTVFCISTAWNFKVLWTSHRLSCFVIILSRLLCTTLVQIWSYSVQKQKFTYTTNNTVPAIDEMHLCVRRWVAAACECIYQFGDLSKGMEQKIYKNRTLKNWINFNETATTITAQTVSSLAAVK